LSCSGSRDRLGGHGGGGGSGGCGGAGGGAGGGALDAAQERLLAQAWREPRAMPVLTDELGELLAANAGTLALLREAFARPRWSWPAVEGPTSRVPNFRSTRQLARLWALEVGRLHAEGRHREALAAALQLGGVGARMEANPACLIDFHLGAAVRDQGAELAFSCARSSPLTADELDALALELDALRPGVDDIERAMLGEYVTILGALEFIERKDGTPLGREWNALERFGYRPNATRNQIAVNLRSMLADLRAGRKPRRPAWPSGGERVRKYLGGDVEGHVATSLAAHAPELAGLCRVLDQVRTAARLLAYERRHGELPDCLSKLGAPRDPQPNALTYDKRLRTLDGGGNPLSPLAF
jgi:hypothetical protein